MSNPTLSPNTLSDALAVWHERLGAGDKAAWRRCQGLTEAMLQPSFPALCAVCGVSSAGGAPTEAQAARAAHLGVMTALALHGAPAIRSGGSPSEAEGPAAGMSALGSALVGPNPEHPRVSDLRFRRLVALSPEDDPGRLVMVRRLVHQLGETAHAPAVFQDLVTLVGRWREDDRLKLAFSYYKHLPNPKKD